MVVSRSSPPCRLVEFGFPAVEPGGLVPDGTGEGGDGPGSADPLEHQVSGSVVAAGERGLAQPVDRQYAPLMFRGHRRIDDDVLRVDREGLVETEGSFRLESQDRGGGVNLERRTDREPFVGPIGVDAPGHRRLRDHTEPHGVAVLDLPETLVDTGGEQMCAGYRIGRRRRPPGDRTVRRPAGRRGGDGGQGEGGVEKTPARQSFPEK